MAHAVKCPVCEGVGGLIQAIAAEFEDSAAATIASETIKECHGCDGRGWVEVSDGDDTETSFPVCWRGQCARRDLAGEPNRYTVWTGAHDLECSPGVRRRK